MDIQRIRREVERASITFPLLEVHPTTSGEILVKAALQTSAGRTYILSVNFPGYPSRMPVVHVVKPSLHSHSPHRYNNGNICYLHPNMWNPGCHDLTFVLARSAKWLNKYEVWCATSRWPGAQMAH